MEPFEQYTETLKEVDENLREAFISYSIASVNDMSEKDGPIGFILLELMKENIKLKKDIDEIRKSHISLMSIYADNN